MIIHQCDFGDELLQEQTNQSERQHPVPLCSSKPTCSLFFSQLQRNLHHLQKLCGVIFG